MQIKNSTGLAQNEYYIKLVLSLSSFSLFFTKPVLVDTDSWKLSYRSLNLFSLKYELFSLVRHPPPPNNKEELWLCGSQKVS
jgi:hypothetical protein